MKRLDFLKHLKMYNCRLLREGGSHSIYINDDNKNTASVPRHRELNNKTCREICKELDIPMPTKK